MLNKLRIEVMPPLDTKSNGETLVDRLRPIQYYLLNATMGNHEWAVPRRYSDFVAFQKSLGDAATVLPKLPPKTIIRTASVIQDRTSMLQMYVDAVVDNKDLLLSNVCYEFFSIPEILRPRLGMNSSNNTNSPLQSPRHVVTSSSSGGSVFPHNNKSNKNTVVSTPAPTPQSHPFPPTTNSTKSPTTATTTNGFTSVQPQGQLLGRLSIQICDVESRNRNSIWIEEKAAVKLIFSLQKLWSEEAVGRRFCLWEHVLSVMNLIEENENMLRKSIDREEWMERVYAMTTRECATYHKQRLMTYRMDLMEEEHTYRGVLLAEEEETIASMLEVFLKTTSYAESSNGLQVKLKKGRIVIQQVRFQLPGPSDSDTTSPRVPIFGDFSLPDLSGSALLRPAPNQKFRFVPIACDPNIVVTEVAGGWAPCVFKILYGAGLVCVTKALEDSPPIQGYIVGYCRRCYQYTPFRRRWRTTKNRRPQQRGPVKRMIFFNHLEQ
eukprot:PhF_6_TR4847/c0_g1_i1/m.6768